MARRVVSRFIEAMEFDSPEALKQYLRDHPGADPKKHRVRPQTDEGGALKSRAEYKPDKGVSKAIDDLGGPAKDNPLVKKLKKQLDGNRPVQKHDVDRTLRTIQEYLDGDETSKSDKSNLRKLQKHLKDYVTR